MLREDTDKKFCSILLDVMEGNGVNTVVLSPGSRNAPFLVSASYRKSLRKYICTDERNAAFMALGISEVSRRPVGLCCTSGTAMYNYAPAIAEAYEAHIPLIVVTADRPARWIGQDDSQTLHQPEALRYIVKGSFNIPSDSFDEEMAWYVNRIANEAMILATSGTPGPVHINIQFDTPLDNTATVFSRTRVIDNVPAMQMLHPRQIRDIVTLLKGKRILIVAGFMPPDARLNTALRRFSEIPGVAVMCETLSNLHLPGNPYAVDSVLAAMTDRDKKRMLPDVVISIGGALVSRMLKEFIRNSEVKETISLGDTYFGIDCFKSLTRHIDISPERFFKIITNPLKKCKLDKESKQYLCKYTEQWQELRTDASKLHSRFVEWTDWSELKAFAHILPNIPQNYNLFLSNGTCVRYGQLFTDTVPHASYCNRGVSGIEGTNATAVGCAMEYGAPTLLITGDMSFAYSPGIMGTQGLPSSFKIIVINNSGGGIFRFIGATREIEYREKYFCADPKVPVEGLAAAYGWKYLRADSMDSLKQNLQNLLDHDSNAILEIVVDGRYSARVLRKYMELKLEKPKEPSLFADFFGNEAEDKDPFGLSFVLDDDEDAVYDRNEDDDDDFIDDDSLSDTISQVSQDKGQDWIMPTLDLVFDDETDDYN